VVGDGEWAGEEGGVEGKTARDECRGRKIQRIEGSAFRSLALILILALQ
jgi:hypothetical protein